MLKSIHKSGINFVTNLQTFILQTHSDRMSESDYYIVVSHKHFGDSESSHTSKLSFNNQGPVDQSIVSLTSSLRVILLTVLADSIYIILIFFAEKM